ncbi:MAG: 1,5-anhydro-D-fructose reductase [Lentisphaerae bacterium ADurb.Bin242]|nr:MAG: 1,5-anhydro-D-fructose reductase [Lentisphaerae bacterium ADurb.Bin242]
MMEGRMISVAVIAAGGRSQGVMERLLADSGNRVVIRSVYDPDRAVVQTALARWKTPDAKVCSSMAEAVGTPGVEWVMVFSPNVFHKEAIVAAFRAGKHVFSEKPLATTLEDCKEIYDAYLASGCLFATGFVLRYSPVYRKAKELLDSGILGKLLSVDATENLAPAHGGYIMQNWRRLTANAGPHLLEKCCHDLDMLNYLIGSLPSKTAGFGGLDCFIPENESLFRKYPKGTYDSWEDPHRTPESPFTSEKNIKDTQVVIFRYRNGVKVQFQATCCNAIPERRMYFSCTEGTLLLDLCRSELKYCIIGDDSVRTVPFAADGHGGGDNTQTRELYEVMCTGLPPRAGGSEGLESAVVALAADQAINEERVIDLEPVWRSLGR